MRQARRQKRDDAGFTLLEVMISMAVMGVGLLAMLMLQVQALKDGSRGKHRTEATAIARDQFELIHNMAFSDPGLDVMNPLVWTTPPWLANTLDATLNPGEIPVSVRHSGGSQRELVYTVYYLVGPDDATTPNTDLRRVDMEVIWNEDGVPNNRPTRTGQPTVALATILVNNDR